MFSKKYLLMSALLFLAIVEVLSRYTFGLGRPLIYEYNEKYQYYTRGGQELRRFGRHIYINSMGMRSPELEYDSKHKRNRILFIGDSVAFGTTYIDQIDIFTSRISQILNDKFNNKYEILNASSPGWAPENELMFIQERGIYNADCVFIVLNTKDLSQPISIFHESYSTPTQYPVSALSELIGRYMLPRLLPSRMYRDPGSTGYDFPPSVQDKLKIVATLNQMESTIKKNGAEINILYIPSRTLDILENQDAWLSGLNAIKVWANKKRIRIIDLTDDFNLLQPNMIYVDGVHLTKYGNNVVSLRVAAAIGSINK